MNFRLISNTLGYILWVEAGFMLLPLAAALLCGENCLPFLVSLLLCAAVGMGLLLCPVKFKQMQRRDGYVAVALSWLLLTLFGALPYLFSHTIPHFFDAVFETASGITTTGATILTAVEDLPKSVILWRSETQWMGGMGVLVLFLALMPKLGDGAVYLMRAESPGPIKSKLVPKVGQTAKILYEIYIGLTLLEMLALRLAGMSWFDALNHAFTTIATGGFSTFNTSIMNCSAAIVWVIIVFTFLAGVNFALFFSAIRGKWGDLWHNEELRVYIGITVAATAFICLNLCVQEGIPFSNALTDAAFQVTTIMTTTGYATRDFALWPTFSRCILLLLMYVGGSAGSTAGGVKVSRLLLLWKSLRREVSRIVHPNHISVITIDGQKIEEQAVIQAHAFQVAYLLVLMGAALVISWDNMGIAESLTASLTCISNVGPGMGALGPMSNFSALNDVSKLTMTLTMLMGRLELMPILALFNRQMWKK